MGDRSCRISDISELLGEDKSDYDNITQAEKEWMKEMFEFFSIIDDCTPSVYDEQEYRKLILDTIINEHSKD